MRRAGLLVTILVVVGCTTAAPSVEGDLSTATAGDLARAASCTDGTKNGNESDVDCGGGVCPRCETGKDCGAGGDCASGVCASGRCAAAACGDGVKNGSESDVDCGGGCPRCPNGRACGTGGDCGSGVCRQDVCVDASCSDGVKNGNESDVDCGGSCPKCLDGNACAGPTDCASGACAGGRCAAPSCSDGVRNGAEGDVDCGGTCTVCADGRSCGDGADCMSAVCTAGRCAVATCSDGVRNGGESDVDCGGGGACARCADGKMCIGGADCASRVCTNTRCVAPACNDGVKNGSETDVDCGGASGGGGNCARCSDGRACAAAGDCASGVCATGACAAATCTDGVKNGAETGVDCGGGTCPGCPFGGACSAARDCLNGICATGACRAPATCLELHTAQPALGDGRYTLDVDGAGGRPGFTAMCDMTSNGGGWTQIAHVRRQNGMPYPGRQFVGQNPDALGYSIDATGIRFTEIAVTHNGLPSSQRFASFALASPQTFDGLRQEIVFLQANGRYSVLSQSTQNSGGWGDIPLACFNTSNQNCLNQSRSEAYASVASGGGNCQQINTGDGSTSGCGGWGGAPNQGNTSWDGDGGRILLR